METPTNESAEAATARQLEEDNNLMVQFMDWLEENDNVRHFSPLIDPATMRADNFIVEMKDGKVLKVAFTSVRG